MTFLSNYELPLLLSCNEIRYSSDYFQKKMGGTQLLGQNSHTWDMLDTSSKIHTSSEISKFSRFYTILQGHKSPHRKMFGTKYITINIKLIIFFKFPKKTAI